MEGFDLDNKEIMKIAMEQSAIDMNCSVEDFQNPDSSVIISNHLNNGAKKCYKNKHFCSFAYYGDGLVASVDKQIKGFIDEYTKKHLPFRCFDSPQIIVLNQELEKYDKCVCFIAEFFLPDLEKEVQINDDIMIRILDEEEIPTLYNDKRFDMALGYGQEGETKDVLAVVGYIDGVIAGVASASNDCDTMWQIGIDVLPQYRKKGVASTLTKILTDEVVKRGKVPYYCTAWSNIASKRNAIKCGYRTAWIEMTAISKKDAMKMIE